MTFNDLECPIQLKVHFTDGTLDVRLLGSGLEGLAPPPCGQLMCCFSAVAELLVIELDII